MHPLVNLAMGLKETGLSPVILANGYFEDFVKESGIEYFKTSSEDSYIKAHNSCHEEGSKEKKIHLEKSYILDNSIKVGRFIKSQLEIFGKDLLVFRIAQDLSTDSICHYYAVDSVSVHLYPSSISGVTPWPYGTMGFTGKILYKIVMFEFPESLLSWRYRMFKKLHNTFIRRKNSAREIQIALFPHWFTLGQVDSETVHFHEFPLFDGNSDRNPHLPENLERFFSTHDEKILFTCGTGVYSQEWFYQASFEIVQKLDLAAIFVSPNINMIKKFRANKVFVIDYVDYGSVIPRVDLVVHHGGIGTCAQSISAGVPQVIRPLAYDQPDNGWRIAKLGLGGLVTSPNYGKIDEMADYFRNVMDSVEIKKMISEFQKKISEGASIESFADELLRTYGD